jgi:hypothetical protein
MPDCKLIHDEAFIKQKELQAESFLRLRVKITVSMAKAS